MCKFTQYCLQNGEKCVKIRKKGENSTNCGEIQLFVEKKYYSNGRKNVIIFLSIKINKKDGIAKWKNTI